MNEGSDQFGFVQSPDELEKSAVAGAVAVEKLIADRNNLRNLLSARERELSASRSAQEDVKRQLGMLHKQYIQLAKGIVSQLHQFDHSLRKAMTGGTPAPNSEASQSEKHFDDEGLLVGPHPRNGVNSHDPVNGSHNEEPLPLER